MRDIWLTAIAPLLWSTTYLMTTEFLPADRPLLAAVLRALPIGLLIVLYFRVLPRGDWWWKAAVLGTLNIGLFFALLFVAAYRIPGGVVATVGALQPIIVMLLSWLLLKERPPTLAIDAGGIGIIGVAVLVLDPGAELDPIGVLAAIGAAASMATGIVLTKLWGRPVDNLPFTGWLLVAGGVMLLPFALIFEALPETLTLHNGIGYLWIGLVNTGIAYGFWFRGIGRLRPYQTSFLGLVTPVGASLLGYVFLAQGFGPRQWLGAALILAGIALAQYAQYRAQHQAGSPGSIKLAKTTA